MEARTPSDSRIAELIRSMEVISAMMSSEQIEAVLAELERTLEAGVPGDDSFSGLPAPGPGDEGPEWPDLAPGTLAVGRAEFTSNLERAGVASPSIREGFFEDLGAADVPDEICWAFLDGDLYQSILTSLELVYPRLTAGGAMVLDDCGWDVLPGVERACADFFRDKPESATVFGDANVAMVVKQIEGQAGG
jgi:Macrocin-O-methyltransferase (TylF)